MKKDEGIAMSSLMDDLYFGQRLCDPDKETIHSAFVGLLHLVSEQNLVLRSENKKSSNDNKKQFCELYVKMRWFEDDWNLFISHPNK